MQNKISIINYNFIIVEEKGKGKNLFKTIDVPESSFLVSKLELKKKIGSLKGFKKWLEPFTFDEVSVAKPLIKINKTYPLTSAC